MTGQAQASGCANTRSAVRNQEKASYGYHMTGHEISYK